MMPMTDWSTINIGAARPLHRLPLHVSKTTFSASNFELEIGLLSEPSKSTKSGPKCLKNPSQDPPKTPPKRALILQTPKIKKNATLQYENLIFDVSRPSKIVPKSMPKRLENQLYLGCPLGTPKNTIFDVKTSPRWTPKISDFFKKAFKNASYHGLWSKMPL